MIEIGSEYYSKPRYATTAKNNEDLDEMYFQSLFWRLGSPKLDEKVDAQFDKLLAANNLIEAYNDSVDEKATTVALTPVLANSNVLAISSTEPECEESCQ